MSRVAVLSDIHGNLPALEAVLADVAAAGVDRIVLNGDLADGPFPAAVLDRLLALGEHALWLRGNGDRWLLDAAQGRVRQGDAATARLLAWSAAQLEPHHIARLADLPLTATLDVAGLGRVGICHATARSDNEMLLVDSSPAQARAALAGLDAPTVLVGHSHMPFDRLFDRLRVVNTGAVGMPYGHDGAAWALLDGAITLRRSRYDARAAAEKIAASGMPDADDFIRTYILATPGDVAALDTFHRIEVMQQSAQAFD